MVSPLRKHPKLLLSLPKGRLSLVKSHLKIDLVEAQSAWNFSRETSLENISKFYFRNCRRVSLLYAFVRKFRPKIVVETGVQNGFSSAFILQAIHDNGEGHLYSIDLPNVTYPKDKSGCMHEDRLRKGRETGFVVPDKLRKAWTLIPGDARVELPRMLEKLGQFDCFYHDSTHTYDHMMFELSLAWEHISNGLILCDDIGWNDAFGDFCKTKNVRGSVLGDIGFIEKIL